MTDDDAERLHDVVRAAIADLTARCGDDPAARAAQTAVKLTIRTLEDVWLPALAGPCGASHE